MLNNFKTKISFVEKQAELAKVFRFPVPEEFSFLPGQFVMIKIELREKNGFEVLDGREKIQTRAFSISSSPMQKGYIETAIKEEENGFVSKYFNRIAELNDTVTISGPYGNFYFQEGTEEIVLLAAGSGITPLISILRYITDKKLSAKAVLIYSNRSIDDTIYFKELQELEKRNPKIKIIFTMTRQPEWPGEKGRVNLDMIKKYFPEKTKPVCFICGSPDFSDSCKDTLINAGVAQEKIKMEKW